MTVLCGGGASQARPGFGASVSVGIAQVAALLNNVPTSVAFAIAGYLGLIGFELSTYCNTDPPPLPVISAGDWAAALLLTDYTSHLAAISKFQDYVANMLWPVLCECSSTSTPAAPGPPAAPSPLPTVAPTVLSPAPASTPCWDKQVATLITTTGFQNLTDTVLPVVGSIAVTGGPSVGSAARQIPAGVTSIQLSAALTIPSPFVFDDEVDLWFFTAAGAVNGTAVSVNDNNNVHPGLRTFTIPANSVYWQLWCSKSGSNGNFTATVEALFYCAGQSPNAPQTPCCPPDEATQALLQTILQLVQSIFASQPAALTSYADATAHTGLSGNGSVLLVDSPLAIRVNVTTDPATLGSDAGNPTFLFDRGYIVPIVNLAPIRGETRLVYNPQMYLLPALTEHVGYSLHSGVIATITELVRGP